MKFNKIILLYLIFYCGTIFAADEGDYQYNSNIRVYSSDIPYSLAEYFVYKYRFDINNIIKIRKLTPSINDSSYIAAANELIYGIGYATAGTSPTTLQFQTDSITNLAPPYNNTVIFIEADFGLSYPDAAAVGYNNLGTPCVENFNLTLDASMTTITSISLGSGNISSECNNQTINNGVVFFNAYAQSYFKLLATNNDKTHYILHEFTHLLGLGHINYDTQGGSISASGICTSVMAYTIKQQCYPIASPIAYIAEDLGLLDQLY